MSCNNSSNNMQTQNCEITKSNNNCSYIIIIVLYILLAIIIGSCLF